MQSALKILFTRQDERKSEIVSRLKEFQNEQKEIPHKLIELLAKGENLRIMDFKLMINEIKAQRVERISLQKERKEDVAKMLQNFRAQRQKLAFSAKAIHSPDNSDKTGVNQAIDTGVDIRTVKGVKETKVTK